MEGFIFKQLSETWLQDITEYQAYKHDDKLLSWISQQQEIQLATQFLPETLRTKEDTMKMAEYNYTLIGRQRGSLG